MADAGDRASKPNLFIFGAPRCGTSSLLHYLREHPEIRFIENQDMEQIGGREKGFPFDSPVLAHSHRDEILSAYDKACARLAGRGRYIFARADYGMYFPHVMHNVADHLPGSKILISLRNPVERAYSVYTHRERDRTFEQTIKMSEASMEEMRAHAVRNRWNDVFERRSQELWMLDRGVYYPAVARVLSVFPREDVHIFPFDDFVRDTPGTMRGILEFLGLDPSFEFTRLNEIRGASKKKDPMNPDTREMLTRYYAEFNRKLFELLDWRRDLWGMDGAPPRTSASTAAGPEAVVETGSLRNLVRRLTGRPGSPAR